jgi:hypothetical protein
LAHSDDGTMIYSDDEVRDRQVAEICFPQRGTRARVLFRWMTSDKVVHHILDVIKVRFACGPDCQPLTWVWFGHAFNFFVSASVYIKSSLPTKASA